MKSTTFALTVLASVAMAQPHGHARRHHHDKRDLVVEWVTEIETVTVIEDEATTQTFYPSKTVEAIATDTPGSPGQFFQASSSSTSTSSTYIAAAPSTTLVVKPSTEQTSVALPTSTSTTPVVVAEPTSSTTSVIEPTTTQAATTPIAETSTYAPAPASTTTAASSGSGENVKNTDMTYYQIGLGSCGYDDAGLDLTKPVVAVDSVLWDSVSTATSYGIDQPAHPFCNQEITITYNGKTTTGVVRDRCGGCQPDAIDVSENIFEDLVGGTTAGRVKVEWYFNSGKW